MPSACSVAIHIAESLVTYHDSDGLEHASGGYNGSRMYDRLKNYPEIMMERLLAIALLALCIGACSSSTDPESSYDLRVRAFKRGETKFTADADRPVTDRLVTLTLRCVPAVSGKGMMILREYGNVIGYWVVVESPVRDTLRRYDSNKTDGLANIIYLDLVANQPVERSWKVRFPVTPRSTGYSFSGSVHLDSVYLLEFDRWYSVHSDTAMSHTPVGWGYNSGDKDDDLHF
jgi:hypothetical protein